MPDPEIADYRDAIDRTALRSLFRRLHGTPMQSAASASILLAAWERAMQAGDTPAAIQAARVLGDQVRQIGPSLQAIEREGLAILDATPERQSQKR